MSTWLNIDGVLTPAGGPDNISLIGSSATKTLGGDVEISSTRYHLTAKTATYTDSGQDTWSVSAEGVYDTSPVPTNQRAFSASFIVEPAPAGQDGRGLVSSGAFIFDGLTTLSLASEFFNIGSAYLDHD